MMRFLACLLVGGFLVGCASQNQNLISDVGNGVLADVIADTCDAHIAFEGQFYDFIDLQERYVAGTATQDALYDAIGGLWSRAAEIDPLVELLHEEALTGRLTISGFDDQIGGAMGYYTLTQLAQRLSRSLPAARQDS